ncbi:MAG: D-alanyl-D-alanine carboxypeptidase [Cyclobacteriaceae bacterium]|nr:D-alanyl-D-alanine carboxypeptidase [Cyclobacteriaceae bacterium]
MRIFVSIVFILLVNGACSPRVGIIKEINRTEHVLKDHTGFALYDLSTKKYLIEYNVEKYFTPASNTKIFTFYTSLKLLGDSATALKYIYKGDSLIFWGMADPSFLYSRTFDNGRAYNFLTQSPEKLFYSATNFKTSSLGPGWAWDDYSYNYSAERSPFPMFGNLITIEKNFTDFLISPRFFMQHFTVATDPHKREEIIRDLDNNQLTFFPGAAQNKRWEVPYHYSSDLIADLLSDTLQREVKEIYLPLPWDAQALKSVPMDSLYSEMMQESDNFIAEQLLLQCAGVLSDTLKPEIAIDFAKKNLLSDLPDEPSWVDGSGLSRYNLFTPRSIVKLWEKIYDEVPQERLFKLLAVGGKQGTIKNWYKKDQPFIFGKTGTLSNNHTLSGYLVTRSRKVLIFSMMNNNYLASTNEVRKRMEKILYTIHERY